MKSTYIAHTPYHVLLANALAKERSDGGQYEQHLIGVLDSDIALMLDLLETSRDTPFDLTYSLPGSLNATGLRKEVRKKRSTMWVRRYVKRERPDELYSFNDHQPVSQGAFNITSGFSDVRHIYVEDGTYAYTRFLPAVEWSRIDSLKMKLFYGRWRKNPHVLGTTDWIDEVRVVFPEYALPELQKRPISPIPRETMVALAEADWFQRYVERTDLDATLDRLDALVFVQHSDWVNHVSSYVETLRSLVESLDEQGYRVGLKYHPRENGEFVDLDRENVDVLSHGVPAEVLFIEDPTIDFVVGNISTALLTARWLLDDATVVSLMRVLEQIERRLLDVYEQLGIHVPKNRAEVAQIPGREY